ncbi:hypothetical protein [Aestuariibius sp. HNIBRBA575]|uniref:hypothetical protein n=1 Tax=Aestuariibius sp. HNIBRBA575 TaxID=3233343 RepID=UPI0034A4032B
MIETALKTDCSQCQGLCCAAYSFDDPDRFAIAKPVDTACPHLQNHGCSIHNTRVEQGFSGCLSYDCHGAGQRVVQDLFPGLDWRDDPALLPKMTAALRDLQKAHEAAAMLFAAADLPLPDHVHKQRQDLMAQIIPDKGWTLSALQTYTQGPLPSQIRNFLRALKSHLPRP